jgi:NAD(P)-dependent dehydrogenase (short-subunit alcohol dehydrogenase family)
MATIDFSGRVAIVTGAGAGLGKDYALELARRGAKVVVNDLGAARDGAGGDRGVADLVVDEIRSAGGVAVPSYDSVATPAGGTKIVNTAVEAFGKVDILVNNAGILRDKSLAKMDEESWDAVLDVHLKGTFCVTQPAFSKMRENGYGRIVMTSSLSGLLGNFGQCNYGAAKMGIAGLANVLKLEGARYNIKVNVLLPSAGTRMTQDLMAPEMFQKFGVQWVTPALVYLCSEQCQETGVYINAFAGYYSRSAVVTGPGAVFSELPRAEDIMNAWERIMSLDRAAYHEDLTKMVTAAVTSLMTAGKK